MNAPLRFIAPARTANPLVASIINAIAAAEHADSFNGHADVGRADIDAWNDAYDARQAMIAQFRAIGLDEAWLGKLSGILLA